MRIARLDFYPSERFPGGGLHGYYLTRHIAEPTLVLTRDDAPFREIPPNARIHAVRYRSPDFGERIDPLRAAVKVFGLARFFLSSLPALLRFRPRIVHLHTPLYLHVALFAKLCLGSRLCMTFHGSDLMRIRRSASLRWLLPRVVDRFFYISEAMRGDLEAFIPSERLAYTPNGVDRELFLDRRGIRKKQIIAVGTLRWQKGYPTLIEAFSRLRAPGYRLVIVGEGPDRSALEELVSRLSLEGAVELAGGRSHAEIASLLNESEIYVMPSVSEGFPKALLEGIACGLPVVATDVGSCRELARGVGLCVPPGDAGELAAALDRMISDGPLREGFASRTAAAAGRYDWRAAARLVERTYRELLGAEVAAGRADGQGEAT